MAKTVAKHEFPEHVEQSKLMTPRTTAIAAVFALAVAVGLAVVAQHVYGKAPHVAVHLNSPQLASYEATVVINAAGFSPAVLDVKPGTRVFFNNEDTSSHRVEQSSESSGTGFGSPDEIAPSTGYVFSFFKPGEYTYHDGNNPTANGEVIVE